MKFAEPAYYPFREGDAAAGSAAATGLGALAGAIPGAGLPWGAIASVPSAISALIPGIGRADARFRAADAASQLDRPLGAHLPGATLRDHYQARVGSPEGVQKMPAGQFRQAFQQAVEKNMNRDNKNLNMFSNQNKFTGPYEATWDVGKQQQELEAKHPGLFKRDAGLSWLGGLQAPKQ